MNTRSGSSQSDADRPAEHQSSGTRLIHGLSIGQLCLLHLETLDEPVTVAERAFLFGNDPESLARAAGLAVEQDRAWSAGALDELGSDPETAKVNLGEARAWSQDASKAAEALAFVRSQGLRPHTFVFDKELDEIRRHEREWLDVHIACKAKWNETENCPTHGAAITAGRERQRQATIALRKTVHTTMRLAEEHPEKFTASTNPRPDGLRG
ncbi:hypothetical protein SAMN04488550_1408 [Gordonia malaquae]|uniref:Uncharacterized protein n=1 Tax=Gordonia malaquae NBRC 108250 TaxID=1223542 RepID=M3UNW4_GORML|nr:hypothetical protein [Gordonia malaquae]GAC81910.1 hypothetical protein GM1_051_00020 [Gordonia malaquae NBRC 108250]SEC16096.1 hypothetical protein SAMN04488550_1408 [Gordonia malaquae]